ncbi:MAG: hypothetical protein JNN03_06000 [Rubrivivax sp.]|nr:hypothetical protein [Rubrivivax sp.]
MVVIVAAAGAPAEVTEDPRRLRHGRESGFSPASRRGARVCCTPCRFAIEERHVAKPNYAFEKRQRELEKKRKKEEKAQRKQRGDSPSDAQGPADAGAADPAPPAPPAER